MSSFDLKGIKHVHFIGIGGISMSALALLMKNFGKTVSGSDRENGYVASVLKKRGVNVLIGEGFNVLDGVDLVVYTNAINAKNVELCNYKSKKIKCMSRGEFLGKVCTLFNEVVAVSGSHGKTTTTAMIAHILLPIRQATLHLGGEDLIYSNFACKGKDVFITEACEYQRNIEHIVPNVGVITNIELDHTDCFKNLDDIKRTFSHFANQTKKDLIIWEDVDVEIKNKQVNLVKVGLSELADINAFKVKEPATGYIFHVRNKECYVGRFILNVCGDYNLKNALCAIATCLQMGISYQNIYSGLKEFKGVKRRNEIIGEVDGVPIIADYAHHPTQVISSIKNAKTKYKKILCIFQPHTYSRTKGLMKEFSSCFIGANELIIFKTYPARERRDSLGSETALYKNIKGIRSKFLALSKEKLFYIMDNDIKNFKAVLVLGAGDIYEIAKKYAKHRKSLDE